MPKAYRWSHARGRYTSDRVHKQCGKNYAFLGHLGRIYLCQHTRKVFRNNLVMSTITSGKNCALQSSHKKISTSDKVIWTIGKSYQFLSNSSQFISGFLNLFQIVLNLFQFFPGLKNSSQFFQILPKFFKFILSFSNSSQVFQILSKFFKFFLSFSNSSQVFQIFPKFFKSTWILHMVYELLLVNSSKSVRFFPSS